MKTQAIAKQALNLPVEERARLAQRLLESLDELSESEAEKLWLAEAARRSAEIEAGHVKLVAQEELETRIKARLK